MNSRKLSLISLALACALLASALFTSVATAAPSEFSYNESSEWLVKGVPLAPGKTQAINNSLAPYTTMTLTFDYGSEPLETVSCTGAELPAGSTAYLESGGKASYGSLKLTGCGVISPSNCSILSSTIQTKALEFRISGEKLIIKAAAFGSPMFTVVTEGARCSISGNRMVSGEITGEFLNPPSTSMLKQPVVFAESQTSWNLGTAFLNGELLFATS